MADKTKFFRILVEGATSDGRVVDRAWIEQMAATYNPATYGARVNCEHIRGFAPEKPFFAYGDVLALKTEQVTLDIGGKSESRLALLAQIKPSDELVRINAAGQKIYTSAEVNPKFGGTDKAYLVGLAVTDSPASLGTEVLAFAAAHPDASPFAARKQAKDNVFTAALETTIEVDGPAEIIAADPTGIFGAFAKLIAPFADRQKAAPVAVPANDNPVGDKADFAAMILALNALPTTLQSMASTAAAATAAVDLKIVALTTKLTTTDADPSKRPPSTGGDLSFAKTDC